MKALEKEFSPIMGFLWCTLTVVFFVLLITWTHPIIAAASYTAMSIVLYRIIYNSIVQINYDDSDFKNTAASFMCAAAWPLYFFFGACLFLNRAIRQE